MKKLAVVLLSGGLDSTTVAAWACSQGYELSAVTVRYGQSHEREIESAGQVAIALGLEHRIVDISGYGTLAWYSALTQPGRYAVPRKRSLHETVEDIPITYVPLRNTFFLTLGAAVLESAALSAIEEDHVSPNELEAVLFIAANAIDYSGYPDCRPEYYEALVKTLHLGSKLGTQYGVSFDVQTPVIEMTKADIVRLAVQVNAPLRYTWSCYVGGSHPCGECESCKLRAKGFLEAGEEDPALTLP